MIGESIEAILAGRGATGSIVIEWWGLGVDCKTGRCVLNLYAQGRNFPEVLAPAAVAGVVGVLTAARSNGAQVHYWPGETASVLFVGRFPA